MVKNCALCGGRGIKGAMRSFPACSRPDTQKEWVDRCDLLPEEGERMLGEFREQLGRDVRIYWCPNHFEGDEKAPIDVSFIEIIVIITVLRPLRRSAYCIPASSPSCST